MKVLVVGATGNVGLRLIPALLTHNHSVVAYVRSASKLTSLLPAAIISAITIAEGDLSSPDALTTALTSNACDALINTSGLPAMLPWQSSNYPALFATVLSAACAASAARPAGKPPLRAWFFGGLTAMTRPDAYAAQAASGSSSKSATPLPNLTSYLPLFREHVQNIALLRTIPTATDLRWSILCPSYMAPTLESTAFTVPTSTPRDLLQAKAETVPAWREGWASYLPLVGGWLNALLQSSRYTTRLEDVAEWIASDLESGSDEWVGHKVAVIEKVRA